MKAKKGEYKVSFVPLNMAKRYLLSFLLLFTAWTASAYIDPYAKQCIVQLSGNIEDVAKDYGNKIVSYSTLSQSMNIHLLYLDIYYEDFKTSILADKRILSFQKNAAVQRRFIPNDPLYPNQGQYKKMGMEQAWNGNNTGLTKNNDTIVIAIIDDGVDISNPELTKNVFINYHEIPNDSIDNDGNGYVDDYYGWNAIQGSKEIFDPIEKARHGSLVTGVIAAQGNNGVGVTGINMNIKYLAVVGGINDADIIIAYDYVLTMKKLYIETKGEKGAYVVSSNSSFGRDRAKEEDALMWCAMYDSMGKYGIISMGATTNSNVDVDVVGDLPSDCSSNFTVIVTDINSENKITGYGKIGVDIAAYGSNSLSTASWVDTTNVGWYKRFSGASAATPYVAGAVGILYANACQSFLNLHDSSPQSAALLAKQFILDGAKFSQYLDGKVTSNGILDVNEMLNKMEEWCINNVTNVREESLANFLVYPNPAKQEFIIELQEEIKRIILYDVTGRVVYEESNGWANKKDDNKYIVSLATVNTGLYFVRIIGKDGKEIGVKPIQKL